MANGIRYGGGFLPPMEEEITRLVRQVVDALTVERRLENVGPEPRRLNQKIERLRPQRANPRGDGDEVGRRIAPAAQEPGAERPELGFFIE